MLALDGAATGRHGAGHDAVDTQQINGGRRAHDVHDRVDCTNLMEMYLVHGAPVYRGFGFGQPSEYLVGELPLTIRQAARVDHLGDVVQVPVGVLVRGRNGHLGGVKAAFADPRDFDLGGQAKRRDGVADRLGVDSSMDERAERHVAADSAEAIEIGNSHGRLLNLPFVRTWSGREADSSEHAVCCNTI